MPIFFVFYFTFGELIWKAHFHLVQVDILKNHDITSCPLRKVIRYSWFSYVSPNKFFIHHKYANKGCYKKFALYGSFVAILWIMKLGVLAKLLEMAPKIKKLYCSTWSGEVVPGSFLHSEQFNGEHTPKSRKLSLAPNFSFWNGSLVVPWSEI